MLACLGLVAGVSLVAAAAEVAIAPDRMLEIDGERTFVVGLYENPKDDAVLADVARAGFNLVRSSDDAAALDRLSKHGLYAWINTGGRIDLGKGGTGSTSGLEAMVASCGSHPALLVWEVPDEALWCCWLDAYGSHKPLKETFDLFFELAETKGAGLIHGYNAIKRLDPKHPVWINHAAGNSIKDLAFFGRAADIVGCDIYPVMPYPTRFFDISRSGLSWVGVCTTRMQQSAPEKPVWMVLQGFGWSEVEVVFKNRGYSGQRPNFHETRFMAYDSIVRGARGILYWGTYKVEKDSELWGDLLKIARELADRQELIAAPDASITPQIETFSVFGKAPIGVKALGKEVGGETWWIVVNEYPFPMAYTLAGLDKLDGTVYREVDTAKEAAVTQGVLKFNIGAYDVHILKPETGGQ
jgi:hypothetical protein